MSLRKLVLIKCSIILILMVFCQPATAEAALAWQTSKVGGSTVQGSTSIALDGNGAVHVLYSNVNDLRYSSNITGSWVGETLAFNLGLPMGSVALDSGDVVHVSYYDPANGNILRYTTNSTGVFVDSDIDNDAVNDVGRFNSIAVDSNDNLYVSYYDATNQILKYATNLTGSWVAGDIDSDAVNDVGRYSSITMDSNDYLHVSYYDGTNRILKYATNKGGSWAIEEADGDVINDVGQYSSIAVDSFGNVHIAYYDLDQDVLKYASNSSGSWVAEVVDNSGGVGEYCSLAIKPDGSAVYISYHDRINNDLKLASGSSNGWSLTILDDSGDVGKFSDIVLSDSGHLYISYYDETNLILKLANQYTLPDTGGSGSSNCFIATAAFGSPLERHVMLLRQFRDQILKSSNLGRAFVKSYYQYAPPVALYLAEHEFLRTAVRWSLVPVVGLSWVVIHFGFMPLIFLCLVAALVPLAWRLRRLDGAR